MAVRAPNRRQVITEHYPSASEPYEAAGPILSKLPLYTATHSFLSVMRDKKKSMAVEQHGPRGLMNSHILSICNLYCLNIAHIIISLTLLSISLSLSLHVNADWYPPPLERKNHKWDLSYFCVKGDFLVIRLICDFRRFLVSDGYSIEICDLKSSIFYHGLSVLQSGCFEPITGAIK